MFEKFVVVSVFALLHLSACEDTLQIPLAPTSVKFNSIEPLKSSNVADVFTGIFGFTLPEGINWQSLAPVNPRKRPEAIMVFQIPGSPLSMPNLDKFPLLNTGNLDEQFNKLSLRLNYRYKDATKKPTILKLDAADNDLSPIKSEQDPLLKDIPSGREKRMDLAMKDLNKDGTFNISQEEDRDFLLQCETIKMFLQSLSMNKVLLENKTPDLFWIKFTGLNSIMNNQEYEPKSFQVKEAKRLTEEIVREAVAVMEHVYPDSCLMAVFCEKSIQGEISRRTRSLLAVADTANVTDLRLAYEFGSDFNVAFVLVAFTSILLTLTVLGISVAMWFMDPGRDSIIYRMTSQRMKKD